MFDFEGKLVYGTEFNLCIVDKEFGTCLKEIRSYEPLRESPFPSFAINSSLICLLTASPYSPHWKEDDPYSGPQEGLLVGREEQPEHH